MSDPAAKVWFFFSELEGQRASSFRQERWCRVFLERAPGVTVFNLRGAFGLHVEEIGSGAALDAVRSRALGAAAPRASVREGLPARVLRRAKHWTLVELYLPGVLRTWREARRRLRSEPGPVAILASSPPFSLVLVGALLKRAFPGKVFLVADMRDAWALHDGLPGPRFLKRGIEGWCLRRADRVVTVSKGLAEEFSARYGVRAEVLYNTATHYFDLGHVEAIDLAAFPGMGRDTVKLVYTGSMPEGHFDIEGILEAARLLRESRPSSWDRLRLVFVGACDALRRALRARPELESLFVFVPHQEHRRAQAIQNAADALLFLGFHGAGNKGVVSTKIFEYFALRRPILALSVQPGSDVDELMGAFCGESLAISTPSEMASALARIADEGPGWLPHCSNPDHARTLFAAYAPFAAEVLACANAGGIGPCREASRSMPRNP
jgi:glycosyltransferase involved in cell wall biosynthesis